MFALINLSTFGFFCPSWGKLLLFLTPRQLPGRVGIGAKTPAVGEAPVGAVTTSGSGSQREPLFHKL